MKEVVYRNFIISYWCKPIPDRRFDYDYAHADYDGPEDNRCGSAASVEDCKSEIDDYWDNWNSAQNEFNAALTN